MRRGVLPAFARPGRRLRAYPGRAALLGSDRPSSLDCGGVTLANPAAGNCGASEYGDPFDVMGNISAMHFNAKQKPGGN